MQVMNVCMFVGLIVFLQGFTAIMTICLNNIWNQFRRGTKFLDMWLRYTVGIITRSYDEHHLADAFLKVANFASLGPMAQASGYWFHSISYYAGFLLCPVSPGMLSIFCKFIKKNNVSLLNFFISLDVNLSTKICS